MGGMGLNRAPMRHLMSSGRELGLCLVAVVEFDIQRGKQELPHGCRCGPEGAGRAELLVQRVGQRLSGVDVTTHLEQCGSMVAPVLHELAWELHGIPLDVVDAGGLGLIDGGEQVLQSVSEFMKERRDFAEGHERGLRVCG